MGRRSEPQLAAGGWWLVIGWLCIVVEALPTEALAAAPANH
jgi:hypothetical protein